MSRAPAGIPDVRAIARMKADLVNSHIDRLRGSFAILVMVGHSLDLANRHSLVDPTFLPLMNLRAYLGFVWVVGFIVLSGYCIVGSCLKAGTTMTWRSFALLRVTRLFPMLLACLLLTVVTEKAMHGAAARPDIWTQGLDDRGVLIANVFGMAAYRGLYGSFAPAYTLSFELVFYALWGVAWFGAGRQPRRALIAAAVSIPVLLLVSRVIAWPTTLPFGLDFTLLLYVCWLIGAFLAVSLRHRTVLGVGRRLALVRWILVAVVLYTGRQLWQMPILEPSGPAVVYFTTLAAAFALVTVGFAARPRAWGFGAVDAALGWLSYPLYLVHGPVIMFTAFLLNSRGTMIPFGLYVLTLCTAGVLSAVVLAVAIERPIMELRRRLRRRAVPVAGLQPAAST
jgi:peptidoglycan/LPS O-acetylase OafA/YrhL